MRQHETAEKTTTTTTKCCLGDSAIVHKLLYSQFVETDDHCTASLWKEMITIQPIVERDDHCTDYCGKR